MDNLRIKQSAHRDIQECTIHKGGCILK